MTKPVLSIVSPTREGFTDYWLDNLLKIEGNVEFILIHPPAMAKHPREDSRLTQINSPFRGEVIQRIIGLLNARGKYVLTINCDEYLTPQIVKLTSQYYARFPDSYLLRLSRQDLPYGDRASLDQPWQNIPDIAQLKICSRDQKLYNSDKNYMLEIPIAPLSNKFDFKALWGYRKDHHGRHTENFDKKVWRTSLVQSALLDITEAMELWGPFKYIPFWALDRLLGLFIQAKFYEENKIIGHLLPQPEQIRIEDNPPEHERSNRFYCLAEILLLKKFPQFGYIWNLLVTYISDLPRIKLQPLKYKLNKLKEKKFN